MAHLYGEQMLSYGCGLYSLTADILNSKLNHDYFCSTATENRAFAYRFKEYNPDDVDHTYPHFTNRIITASAGPCIVYEQINAINATACPVHFRNLGDSECPRDGRLVPYNRKIIE